MTINIMDTIKLGKLTRAISSSEIKVDSESRSIEFPFSSELPVERWFGKEILSHKDGAFNFDRLNTKAPLLFNHKMDELIGVVEKAWMGDDKRGWVKVRFSQNEDAQEKLRDVQDGILQNVSFGYMIKEMMLTKSGDDGEEYTATSWEPYEVSLVTVPADPSVGIGRSESADAIEIKVIRTLVTEPTPEPEKPEAATAAPTKERKMEPKEIATIQGEAVKAERERQTAIRALGAKFSKPDLAESLINGEKTIEEARAAFLDAVGVAQKPLTGREADLGMTDKDIASFSIVRLINALGNPTDRAAQKAAGFELEIARAASEKAGKASRGAMIPVDVLRAAMKRDLTVGTPTAGGNLVATDLLSQSFIDLLRKRSILQAAGVTTLNGLVGNIAIPRQTGAATAYWVAEGSAPTESQQSVDQVSMSPKTVAAYTDFSRKLMLQSSIDVEAMVRRDLATVLALEIDRAGLYGLGASNQPTGLKLQTGVNTADFAAATPTFAEVVSMETAVNSDNALAGNLKYIFNAAMGGALKTAEKASGYPVYIFENGQVNGYEALVSNQVESNDIFFGNWSEMIMGFWSGLDLMVDPYAQATSGGMRVIAFQDVDVAVRHGESFCRGNVTIP